MSIAHSSEALGGLPVIGTDAISSASTVAARDQQTRTVSSLKEGTLAREEMERLAQRVFLSANGNSPRCVVFSGIDKSHSSAMVCARVGQALAAKSYRRVCIVDSDCQTNHIRQFFEVGTLDQDRGPDCEEQVSYLQARTNLWIAGGSALGYREGLSPDYEKITSAIQELRREFDYVLINVTSAGSRCDAALLGKAADGLILVLKAGSTRRKAAQTVVDSIRAAEVMLLGAVLDDRTYPIPASLYHRL